MSDARTKHDAAKKVDMLAAAREAQWSALTFMGSDAIKVVAPAKVNLFLDVGARRADGLHEVQNIMHALALHDTLYLGIEESPDLNITVECVVKDCGAPDIDSTAAHFPLADVADNQMRNLAYQAIANLADAMKAETGKTLTGNINVRIEKCIPAQAGLGGGSSDAAAALVGAAALWNIPLDSPLLEKVARELGADVAFFLRGGCVRLDGAGENFAQEYTPMKKPLVLVKPACGVSTGKAYAAFDEAPTIIDESLLQDALNASNANQIPLANNLTDAAIKVAPELGELLKWLSAENVAYDSNGKPQVLLCGSGSTVFAITETYDDALKIATHAQAQGYWSRATTFSGLRAAKVG